MSRVPGMRAHHCWHSSSSRPRPAAQQLSAGSGCRSWSAAHEQLHSSSMSAQGTGHQHAMHAGMIFIKRR